jgi:peptidoglycan-N-acetylglucosamine deacetylase
MSMGTNLISFAWVVASIALMFLCLYGGAVALRLLIEWQLRSRSRGRLVLTFDDGPSPVATKAIRQWMQRESVKATFFVTGFRSEEHKELVVEALAEGHDVGSHGFSHPHGWRHPFMSVGDVSQGLASLRSQHPGARFFRPPYGKATLMTHLVCWVKGFRTVYWTIDCKDAERDAIREPQDIVAEFLRKGGGVVLLHDLDIGAAQFPGRNAKVLAICDALVACAKSRGMPVSTVSEVFK